MGLSQGVLTVDASVLQENFGHKRFSFACNPCALPKKQAKVLQFRDVGDAGAVLRLWLQALHGLTRLTLRRSREHEKGRGDHQAFQA
jgi:hypothetical protein